MHASRVAAKGFERLLGSMGFAAGARRWLAPLIAENRWLMTGYALLIALAAALAAVPAFLIQRMIDVALPRGDLRSLVWLTGIFVGIGLLIAAISWAEAVLDFCLSERLEKGIRERMFGTLLEVPLETYIYSAPGTFMSRLLGDAGALRAVTGALFGQVLRSGLEVLAFAGALLAIDWRLGAVVLPVLPVAMIVARAMLRHADELERAEHTLTSVLFGAVERALSLDAMTHVRLFGRAANQQRGVEAAGSELMALGVRRESFVALFSAVVVGCGTVLVAVGYLVGGWMVQGGLLTVGSVVASVALVGQLHGPLTSLMGLRLRFASARTAMERCHEVVARAGDHTAAAPDDRLAALRGSAAWAIRVRGVSLDYRGRDIALHHADGYADPTPAPVRVLERVSFDITGGALCAFAGPSGSGKTSAAGVIAGLFQPSEGTLAFDGIPVVRTDFEHLRPRILIVTQASFFFDDTVAENLRLGAPEADMAALRDACRKAAVLDLVDRLPRGFDEQMGVVGARFSAGERQRLSLARAIVARPAVLVCDEVTANVDRTSRRIIQNAILSELDHTTRIIISHEESWLAQCDQVVSFAHGAVVA